LLVIVAFVACQKEEAVKPSSNNSTPVDNTTEKVNDNKPTGNSLILNQRLIGDTTKSNTIYRILEAGDGGFYFLGLQESNNVVGKLSASGIYLWTQKIGFEINSLALTKIATTSGSDRLAICGKNIVSFFTLNGAFDKDIYINQPSNVMINDIQSSGNGVYIIGSAEKNSVLYPIYGLVPYNSVSSTSIVINTMDNLTGFEFRSFSHQAKSSIPTSNTGGGETGDNSGIPSAGGTSGGNGSDSGGGIIRGNGGDVRQPYFSFICLGRQTTSDKVSIKATLFSIVADKNQTIVWQRDLTTGSGFKSATRAGNGTVTQKDGLLYAVGYTEQIKSNTPPNGYWYSGLIACVKATDGSLIWQKAHSITNYNDGFARIYLTTNNEIFVSGEASNYYLNKTNKSFGYGLLARINASTGDMISYKTFGDETKYSGFNHLYIKDNQLFTVGFTNQNYDNSGFQAWFVELNKNF
jgi:uncharacterized membrane protein YgcG